MKTPIQKQLEKQFARGALVVIGAACALVLVASMGEASAGELYKCGRTYSDQPCGPDQVKLAVPSARLPVPKSAAIKPGMTEAQALAALDSDGWPVREIVLESGATVYKQYVVGRHIQNKWYVFTRDGVVTSVLW